MSGTSNAGGCGAQAFCDPALGLDGLTGCDGALGEFFLADGRGVGFFGGLAGRGGFVGCWEGLFGADG